MNDRIAGDGESVDVPDVVRVQARGQLDWDSGEDFACELEQALGAGAGTVVVDVSELEFADSSVLNNLFNAHVRQRADGGRLVLTGALSPALERCLRTTGALEHFTFTADSDPDATDAGGIGAR